MKIKDKQIALILSGVANDHAQWEFSWHARELAEMLFLSENEKKKFLKRFSASQQKQVFLSILTINLDTK